MLGTDVQREKAGEGGEGETNSLGKPARPHKLKANTAAESKNQLRVETQDSSATERAARRAQTLPAGEPTAHMAPFSPSSRTSLEGLPPGQHCPLTCLAVPNTPNTNYWGH